MASSSPPATGALAALRAIAERFPSDLEDVDLLRGRLADREIPSSEINLLVNAVADGVPQRIRRERAETPREVLLGILTQRLIAGQGMSPDRAGWTASVWLDALAPSSQGTVSGIRGTGDTTQAGTGLSAQTVSPADTSIGARVASRRPLLAAAAVLGAVLAGAAWLTLRGSDYTVERISFFVSDGPLEKDLNASQNYNAWCDAGASLVSTGPPPWPCAAVFPFSTTVPRIKVELLVAYDGSSRVEVPVTCELRNVSEQVIAVARATGVTPNPSYPRLGRTWWLTAFERPEQGWAAGRYHAICEAADTSLEGWFDIRD